jgi:ATP-binding cassette subfamily F protein 3
VKLGHNVVSEYFAQDQYKVLDGDARMLDDISRAALKVPEVELRSLLGCFLFAATTSSSRWACSRAASATATRWRGFWFRRRIFLLLDEPTNHLDMRAKDVLLEALAAFSGTVVFVSHDRYFIDRLATRVLEVEAARSPATRATTRTICAGRRRRRRLQQAGHPERSEGPAVRSESICIESRSKRGNGRPEEAACVAGRPPPPPESHQAEADGRALRVSGRRVPRIEAAIAHTEEQLGVYVSAAETQRLTDAGRGSARAAGRPDRRVGRADENGKAPHRRQDDHHQQPEGGRSARHPGAHRGAFP